MRIAKIAAKGLFGIFEDYEITLRDKERITIIHGPNGSGKTILLRMIHGLFNSRYGVHQSVPYSEFRIDFDDGQSLWIRPKTTGKKGSPVYYYGRYGSTKGIEQWEPNLSRSDERDIYRRLGMYLDRLDRPGLGFERTGPSTWRHMETGEILGITEILENAGDAIPEEIRSEILREPNWFRTLVSEIPVQLIGAQRLLDTGSRSVAETLDWPPSYRESLRRPPDTRRQPTVVTFSKELVQTIGNTVRRFSEMSQSLDRTFPARVFQEIISYSKASDTVDAYENLRQQLDSLEKKRTGLVETGLLGREDSGANAEFQIPEKLGDATQREYLTRVLSVYVQDIEKKLGVYDEIAGKIRLLKELIDKRFHHKKLVIDRDKGILLQLHNGEIIQPQDLSSGEQHEVVLFYELLFRVKPDSLVLIDEPELSLHIAWQQEFLKDLASVIGLTRLDVLIATHSPDIIHDRWDLTESLVSEAEE